MIIKHIAVRKDLSDPRRIAGHHAESQMAFHLNRAFANDSELFVLHDLRIIDEEQSEHDGSPRIAQIDHLVLHRWGAFIIESKSAYGEVFVEPDQHGGQSWYRKSRSGTQGFRCPIQQARMQGEQLRTVLQRNATVLRGRVPVGFRTVVKMINGTDQRGFKSLPIQVIVAFAETTVIRRQHGWKEPTKPFRCFILKDDHVVDRIRNEHQIHKSASSLLAAPKGEYGIWMLSEQEVKETAEFLAELHNGGSISKPSNSNPASGNVKQACSGRPLCKGCEKPALTANWGKYGYYWHCAACNTNTAMPTTCSACGTKGERGRSVRIKKTGSRYDRCCEACGHTETVWTEPPAPTISS